MADISSKLCCNIVDICILPVKSKAKCKTAESLLLTHWEYCSIALSHRNAGLASTNVTLKLQFVCAGECKFLHHYSDVIMGAMVSHITSLTIVYSTVYSGAYQRKHQSWLKYFAVLFSIDAILILFELRGRHHVMCNLLFVPTTIAQFW